MKGMSARRSLIDTAAMAMTALVGVGLSLFLALPLAPRAVQGDNDFPVFYVAAEVSGSPRLWDEAPYMEFQQRQFGDAHEALVWIRPPFYALLLKPLSWLPFEQANAAWLAARLAALGLAAAVWGFSSTTMFVLAMLVSPPLMANLLGGQDVPFVLAAAAAALFAAQRERPLTAGLLLSLASIKFNLLLPLPLLLAAQRRWRMLAGLAGGGLALAALSVPAAGWSWPLDYWTALQQERIHPNLHSMPSLSGLLSGAPGRLGWQIALTLAVLALAWLVSRRAELGPAMAFALAAGVLVAPHAYLADCLLLTPALLFVVERGRLKPLKLGAMILLFPPALWLLAGSNHLAAQLAVVAFVAGFAVDLLRGSPSEATPA